MYICTTKMEKQDPVLEVSENTESDKSTTSLREDSISTSGIGDKVEAPAPSLPEHSPKPFKDPPVLLFGNPQSLKSHGKSALFEFGSKTLTAPASSSDGDKGDVLDQETVEAVDNAVVENVQVEENTSTVSVCEADSESKHENCNVNTEVGLTSDETNIVSLVVTNRKNENIDTKIISEDQVTISTNTMVSSSKNNEDLMLKMMPDETCIVPSEIDSRDEETIDVLDIPENVSSKKNDEDQMMTMSSDETSNPIDSSEIDNGHDENVDIKGISDDVSSNMNDDTDDSQMKRTSDETYIISLEVENKHDEGILKVVSEDVTSNQNDDDGEGLSEPTSSIVDRDNKSNDRDEKTVSQIAEESHKVTIGDKSISNDNNASETHSNISDTVSEISREHSKSDAVDQEQMVEVLDGEKPEVSSQLLEMEVDESTLERSDPDVEHVDKGDDPEFDVDLEDVEVSVFGSDSTDEISRDFLKSLREKSKEILGKGENISEIKDNQVGTDNSIKDDTFKDSMEEEQTAQFIGNNKEAQENSVSFEVSDNEIMDVEQPDKADDEKTNKSIGDKENQCESGGKANKHESKKKENQSEEISLINNLQRDSDDEVMEVDSDFIQSNKQTSTKTNVAEKSSSRKESPETINEENEDSKSDKYLDPSELTDLMRSALAKNKEFRKSLTPVDNTKCKEAEVISLVDDDDEDTVKKKKPAAAINCVNPNCMSGEDLDRPPMFVLSYFGLKRAKDQRVCAECFNFVIEHQEKLAAMLVEGKPLLLADFPDNKDVILLDSDEESLSDEEDQLSDDTMEMIQNNLDDVIVESLVKYNLEHQVTESVNILDYKIEKLEDEAKRLTKSFDEVQKTLDEFRKTIYEDYHQPITQIDEVHFSDCEIPPMPIVKSKLQNILYNQELMKSLRKSEQEEAARINYRTSGVATKRVGQVATPYYDTSASQDVIAVHSEMRVEPPSNLPAPGNLVRRKLRVGDQVYTMKVSYFSIWVLCRVIEIIPRNTTEIDHSTETYRIRLENVKKNSVRTVTGKYLAYPTPSTVQLKVGTRVIAIFREEDEDQNIHRENYYVGVVAEPPKITNKYRYLVFFDDGYTQYCPHENILVVCSSSKNVWDDIHPEPRDFIRNYLQQYPERPMVKMSKGQVVKVEWNGKWWIVRVLEIDSSLVKVHFDADSRTEWIYRGSTRLGPMYQAAVAAKERQSGSLLRSRGFGGAASAQSDMPYVEYTRGDSDEKKDEDRESAEEELQLVPTRSVARKSTSKKAADPVISNPAYSKPLLGHIPQGTVKNRKIKRLYKPLHFRPHQCNRTCVEWTKYSPAAAKEYDPLVKPLVFGFSRLNMTFKGKTTVMYKAPCGRMIRTPQEMLCYLQGTKSSLTIDLFDFDFWVNPLSEFKEDKTFCRIEDLSYGKENVKISCVNDLDHEMPQYVTYMTAREPASGVNLNLDPGFLVGCDCTDDCEDRDKCSCWQLTMQGKNYNPNGDLDPLFGYQYRRLPERIPTGIYECNARCKCSATCQNRVAQQALQFRLQLFKTYKKGWGIRSLHDIPKGSFICIYAGFLLTEQDANEGGKTYGDEYLAELDYIESVENLKEGYEEEARGMSDSEDERDDRSRHIDIEYEQDINSINSDDIDIDDSRPQQNIRLRLRRRNKDDGDEVSSRKSKTDDDTISISDEEGDTDGFYYTVSPISDKVRKPQTFNVSITERNDQESKYTSVRDMYGRDEYVYIMDAKTHGNIGRYLNHSCSPNVFVQNVFVDTHDLRFPWVAFFAGRHITAGTELTWDYNYDVGSVPGKVMLCYCNSSNCRGRLL